MLPGVYMATLDLEDAYLLVPIAEDHRHFLRFQWRNITYEFSALFFGLFTAPYIFTKILRPVVAFLHRRNYQSCIYLDDFILFGSSFNECETNVRTTIDLLQSLGFRINYIKSRSKPAVKCKYLGLIFDSVKQSIAIPPPLRENLSRLCSRFARLPKCSEFASFIGSLISVCPAVSYGLLHTKRFEREKFLALSKSNEDFSAIMDLPPYLEEDFSWWQDIFSNHAQSNKIRLGVFVREIFTVT